MGAWAKILHIAPTPISAQENKRSGPPPPPSNASQQTQPKPSGQLSKSHAKHAVARRVASLPVEAKQNIINSSLDRTTISTLPALASALVTHVKTSYLRGYSARSQAFACTLFAAAALRTSVTFTSALENTGLRLEMWAVVPALHTLWQHRDKLMEIVKRYRGETGDFLLERSEWSAVRRYAVSSENTARNLAKTSEDSRRKLAGFLKKMGRSGGEQADGGFVAAGCAAWLRLLDWQKNIGEINGGGTIHSSAC